MGVYTIHGCVALCASLAIRSGQCDPHAPVTHKHMRDEVTIALQAEIWVTGWTLG